jgi:hypothetical protein
MSSSGVQSSVCVHSITHAHLARCIYTSDLRCMSSMACAICYQSRIGATTSTADQARLVGIGGRVLHQLDTLCIAQRLFESVLVGTSIGCWLTDSNVVAIGTKERQVILEQLDWSQEEFGCVQDLSQPVLGGSDARNLEATRSRTIEPISSPTCFDVGYALYCSTIAYQGVVDWHC